MTSSGRRQAPARRIRPFTPAQEPAAALSQRTVGRDEVLQVLVARLISAATSRNRAHSLLVGPRGFGKTHLLNVAIYRALAQSAPTRRLIIVRFDEDAVGITRYFDLLREVLLSLAPNQSGRKAALPMNPEEAISAALGDRVLVLVIENLDRVFHALGEGGQQDFRSWVENSGQIMVLASTPALFPGVSNRAMPWWGNFGISHLDELDLEQGRELLIKLAAESADMELADFLMTDQGEARLRALSAVAGGSPRIWTILSECLTVELLDELVPAVEALLEGLVPYYQQLLWDLSPVEQRLVRVLADGAHQAATVAELAQAAGIGQRVAATTLGRLADIHWVRPEKAPELDRRSTWYRLQEPMLRHHLHYRSATDQPLPLIVEVLKTWFEPEDRRKRLAAAEPTSEVERLLAATLRTESGRYDLTYADRDLDSLLVEARCWIHGQCAESRTAEAGALIDVAVAAVRQGPAIAASVAAERNLTGEGSLAAAELVDYVRQGGGFDPQSTEIARFGELLRIATERTSGRTHVVLGLISAWWDRDDEPGNVLERLLTLRSELLGQPDELFVEVSLAVAELTGKAGDAEAAQALCDELLRLPGDGPAIDMSTMLDVRFQKANWAGLAGEQASARDQFKELVPMCDALWGPDSPPAGVARCGLALWTGLSGDVESALEIVSDIVLKGELTPPLSTAAVVVFRRLISRWFHDAPTNPPTEVFDLEAAGIPKLLVAAVNGSAEALVRLPSELVPIVEALRAQRSGSQAAPALA